VINDLKSNISKGSFLNYVCILDLDVLRGHKEDASATQMYEYHYLMKLMA